MNTRGWLFAFATVASLTAGPANGSAIAAGMNTETPVAGGPSAPGQRLMFEMPAGRRRLSQVMPADEPPTPVAARPPGGQKICMLGDDRKCGPNRSFGPWRVDEALRSPACSPHFCIHWVPRTKDAPHSADRDGDGIANYIETVTTVAEHSYRATVDRFGWQPPLPDGGKGGDDRTDIYLFNTDKNTRANALALVDAPHGIHARHRSGWLIIDDDYDEPRFHGDPPRRVLKYYIPHEFNHIVQAGYDVHLDRWVWEASAEWMASRIFPRPQWYAFTGSLAGTTTQPLYRRGYRSYSLLTWNEWLASRLGADVVRRVWETADQYPKQGHRSTEIFDDAIKRASRGTSSFGREFLRFATATAEWSNRDFASGNHFADINREGTLRPRDPATKLHLAQSAWALYDVELSARRVSRYRLSVDVSRRTPAGIALIGRRGGRVTRSTMDLPHGGPGSVSLRSPQGGFERLTAVLVNTDIRRGGYEGKGKPGFVARVGTR